MRYWRCNLLLQIILVRLFHYFNFLFLYWLRMVLVFYSVDNFFLNNNIILILLFYRFFFISFEGLEFTKSFIKSISSLFRLKFLFLITIKALSWPVSFINLLVLHIHFLIKIIKIFLNVLYLFLFLLFLILQLLLHFFPFRSQLLLFDSSFFFLFFLLDLFLFFHLNFQFFFLFQSFLSIHLNFLLLYPLLLLTSWLLRPFAVWWRSQWTHWFYLFSLLVINILEICYLSQTFLDINVKIMKKLVILNLQLAAAIVKWDKYTEKLLSSLQELDVKLCLRDSSTFL